MEFIKENYVGFLTWCEECGDDMQGQSYECPYCEKELCYGCYQEHKTKCPDRDGIDEAFERI